MRETFSLKVWVVAIVSVQCVSACAQNNSAPLLLVSFVAPAYPRIASDARMTGTTVTHIKIGKDGRVIEVKTVSAHPLFAKHVLDALKQWRFAPSNEEHEFDVTCRFEFYDPKGEMSALRQMENRRLRDHRICSASEGDSSQNNREMLD